MSCIFISDSLTSIILYLFNPYLLKESGSTICLRLFCDIRYILESAIFFIKLPSLNPSFPAILIAETASSVAFTVVNDQDFTARSEMILNLLLSLTQYTPELVLTASPEGIAVGLFTKAV